MSGCCRGPAECAQRYDDCRCPSKPTACPPHCVRCLAAQAEPREESSGLGLHVAKLRANAGKRCGAPCGSLSCPTPGSCEACRWRSVKGLLRAAQGLATRASYEAGEGSAYPVRVKHVHDGDELAVVGTIVDQAHPADLHVPAERHPATARGAPSASVSVRGFVRSAALLSHPSPLTEASVRRPAS